MGLRSILWLLFTLWVCATVISNEAFSLKKNFNELRNLRCKEKTTGNSNDNEGFAPFKLITVYCRSNVSPSTFVYAKCKKRCEDPIKNDGVGLTKKKQKLYMQKEVWNMQKLTVRMAGRLRNLTRQIPISCRCVRKPGT